MARFFIDRPVFAWVIAIVIMLAGVMSIMSLPIAQYPPIAPPAVSINATYPGASAKTLEDSVTQVVEQQMKGLDGLMYMSSTSDSSGQATITLTFESGTDPDIAQVQVQNKLQLATPMLPEVVQRQGLSVTKATRTFMRVLAFYSEDGGMTGTDIADYIATNVLDTLSRVQGVGETTLFGSQYAMRIWLDPTKLESYKLTTADVRAAVQDQNAQVSAGQLGGLPAMPGQQINVTVMAQDRLKTPEEFEKILLRVNPDGSTVRLRDVARVEIGSESYAVTSRYNGMPATGIAIRLASGANALDTAEAVEVALDKLKISFPEGLKVDIAFDTVPVVKTSIEEVVKTLGEAIVLVVLVMFLFLQNFRATLIPTIAVPVVLLGTFGVLAAFGYSINTLTMFAMVLAIGLLVDDAIVVVENVERIMSTEGLPPKEATRKSMDQISSALVGIALVLSAVFVPMAFFGGATGVIYRQFSVTIVSAMMLSVLVALILTPALCATMLKPVSLHDAHAKRGFFALFNRVFDASNRGYTRAVGGLLCRRWSLMIVYVLLVAGMAFLFKVLPTAFLPEEDQGMLFSQVVLPVGSTQEQAREVLNKVEDHFLQDEKDSVQSMFSVAGFSYSGRGQNMGMAFVRLKDWSERQGEGQGAPDLRNRAMAAFSQFRNALAFAFTPPAVMELGNASGFDLQLQDVGGLGHERLMQARNQLLGMAGQNPMLVAVRPNGQEDTPQFRIDVDREKAGALGLSLGDVYGTLSTAWGGTYINDFIDKGRVKKVYMQADAPFRMMPEDLSAWRVRSASGEMTPFSAFTSSHWEYGSPRLERYNGMPSVEILGQPAPGQSSGDAMAVVESLADQLPQGIGYSWTGVSYQERMAGSQTTLLYSLSILVVFLCLAALYESWSVPFSVILVVPLGVIGALGFTFLRGLSNDVYFQVGLLATIGLSAKNAILIVEFAKELYESGHSLYDATKEAVQLRLRPILMTSFAFVLGVLPLVLADGAGSGSQQAIGTSVMGGTLSATFLGIFFVPVFFVLVYRVFNIRRPDTGDAPAATETVESA